MIFTACCVLKLKFKLSGQKKLKFFLEVAYVQPIINSPLTCCFFRHLTEFIHDCIVVDSLRRVCMVGIVISLSSQIKDIKIGSCGLQCNTPHQWIYILLGLVGIVIQKILISQ